MALRIPWLALFVGLTTSSCNNIDVRPELRELRKTVEQQSREIEKLRLEVNDGLTLALCSPELRQLLENVTKECTPAVDSREPAQCTTRQIKPSVLAADPERKDRFLKLMSHLPHEVIYINPGATEIVPQRYEKIDRLASRALLLSTVFLVVSSPEAGQPEAERRAEFVEQLLIRRKVAPAKIRRWLYSFPTNRLDIVKKGDLPMLVETAELSRGVWIFRADC